jgi:hypothetical protein
MTSVRTQVKTLLFVWFAVTILILSTACSKKSSSPRSTTSPNRQAKAANDRAMGPMSAGNAGGQSQRIGPAVQPGATVVDLDQRPSANAPGESSGGSRIRVVDYDPRGKTPDQIFGDQRVTDAPEGTTVLEPREGDRVNPHGENGGRVTQLGPDANGQPLYFSGSGQDRLYEKIKELMDAETDAEQKTRNEQFAKKIGFTTFEPNYRSRSAVLTVNIIERNGQQVPYVFSGQLDNQLRFKSGDLNRSPNLEAEAVCMDLRGGCNTVHVKLRKKSGEGVSTVSVLARHTTATLYSEGNSKRVSNNAAYDRFVHILTTSVDYPGGANSLKTLHLTTSEVINGSSEFAVTMSMRMSLDDPERTQSLSFIGPLVKPMSISSLDLPVDTFSGYTIYGRWSFVSQPVAETIRESRLVRNDGRGNLQIDVTFAQTHSGSREDTVRLTISRIHEPVRELILN